jgi:hypothetical protein
MTAIELANQLDHESDLGECKHYEAAAMLRKQDAAIKQLRDALRGLVDDTNDEYIPSRLWDAAMAALEATEEHKC